MTARVIYDIKSHISLILAMVFFALFFIFSPSVAHADDGQSCEAKGGVTYGMDWIITTDCELLLGKEGEVQTVSNNSEFWPWRNYTKGEVKSVRFIGKVVADKKMYAMFRNLVNIDTVENLDFLDTSGVNSLYYLFQTGSPYVSSITHLDGLSNWDTSNITQFSYAFAGLSKLESLDLSGWDTSNATNMAGMFSAVNSLESITFGPGWTKWLNDAYLSTPRKSSHPAVTGKWIRKDNSLPAKTPQELYNELPVNATEYAGEWVWEVKYKVNHYKLKEGANPDIHDEENYELAETEDLTAPNETQIAPEVKTYEGFISPSTQTITTNEDEIQIVNYYYTPETEDPIDPDTPVVPEDPSISDDSNNENTGDFNNDLTSDEISAPSTGGKSGFVGAIFLAALSSTTIAGILRFYRRFDN